MGDTFNIPKEYHENLVTSNHDYTVNALDALEKIRQSILCLI